MKRMRAKDLVFDPSVYPRTGPDPHNTLLLADALVAGAELPPILIDKATKRIVDGVHRREAHLRVYGDDAKLDVAEKSYKNDADLFLDAMRFNATHGAKLDTCDRSHCLLVAERLQLSVDAVAGALSVPANRLGPLKVTRVALSSNGLRSPLKRTVSHFAGRTLTLRQEVANKNLSGMNQSFYANQLIELIESDMLDTSNDQLFERLRKLRELLDSVL